MNAKEAQELARLLDKMPGIKSVELKDVRKLAELLKEFPEIGSIELKGFFDTGIVMTRTGMALPAAVAMAAPVPVAQPVASVASSAASSAPGPTAAASAASALKEIRSPMVGTFYKSPEPGAEAYVKVGSRVTSGQAVCIIEAMKIMNEIEAEFSGVVREVLVEDAQPVEFGTVLFRVDPNG
ncbi:MAG TPA: acetyl-CoA carboxylase biotin carboxyl carrier protein [Gemmatimonadales bacterium]|nr:acetyl-CoA carboxylase biotin carboxyl carrier protein [Gemmatimonadales bacterium]